MSTTAGVTMNKWLVSVSIAMMVAAGTAQAEGNVEAGKARSMACMACHGADGNSIASTTPGSIWPKLAGQHPQYIAKQLHDFKSQARKDPIMNGMAMPLTDEEIANLAAYFSSQKQSPGTTAADQVELGQKIFRSGNGTTQVSACSGCHGPDGMGNPTANFPRISGQHAAYIEKTLKDFRAGVRANDPQKMMQGVVSRMTDAEIAAVAQYVQGLH